MMNKTKKYNWRYYVAGNSTLGFEPRIYKKKKYAKKYSEKTGGGILQYIPHPLFDEV